MWCKRGWGGTCVPHPPFLSLEAAPSQAYPFAGNPEGLYELGPELEGSIEVAVYPPVLNVSCIHLAYSFAFRESFMTPLIKGAA